MTINAATSALFNGKKEKWLPLYRRLLARFSRVPGIEITLLRTAIALCPAGMPDHPFATIRVTLRGLTLSLILAKTGIRSNRLTPSRAQRSKTTHSILIADISEIDDEILSWVKAANHQARISKRQST